MQQTNPNRMVQGVTAPRNSTLCTPESQHTAPCGCHTLCSSPNSKRPEAGVGLFSRAANCPSTGHMAPSHCAGIAQCGSHTRPLPFTTQPSLGLLLQHSLACLCQACLSVHSGTLQGYRLLQRAGSPFSCRAQTWWHMPTRCSCLHQGNANCTLSERRSGCNSANGVPSRQFLPGSSASLQPMLPGFWRCQPAYMIHELHSM